MLENPETISLIQTILISLCGMCIVFLCLACLIVAIKIMGILFMRLGLGDHLQEKGSGTGVKPVQPDTVQGDNGIYAVLLCAVSHAAGIPLDKMRIKSIKKNNEKKGRKKDEVYV